MAKNPPLSSPPRWADRLLERFCAPEKLEEVLGDLHERYYRNAKQVGLARANRRYLREVIAYMRLAMSNRASESNIVGLLSANQLARWRPYC